MTHKIFFLTIFSKLWSVLINLIFIPLYVDILGVESFGLITFYSTLSTSLSILDVGFSTAVTREIAIFESNSKIKIDRNNLIQSVEIIYWVFAFTVGIILLVSSDFIAREWLNTVTVDIDTISNCIKYMSIVLVFQFPISLYNGILIGISKQNQVALLSILYMTLKNAGVFLIIYFFNKDIELYFLLQAAVMFFTVLLFKRVIKSFIEPNLEFRFSLSHINKIWKFITGMTGISLVTFFLTQIDKLIVSKTVSLENVGYYNLAFTVSGIISQGVVVIQSFLFPKFTELYTKLKSNELMTLYYKSCTWVSIIIFPISLQLIFYAKEILLFWTGNTILTHKTSLLMQVVTMGATFNALMWVPYFYLLSRGITKFTFYQNIIIALISVPLIIFLSNKYGILGAGVVWLFVNICYVLFSIPLIHYLYIHSGTKKWFLESIIVPFFYSLVVFVPFKYLQIHFFQSIGFIQFLILLVTSGVAYIIIVPQLRFYFLNRKIWNQIHW
ncbi:oligosaccharide flippase family protein [Runella sp. CRIBMP]|uniref:oligosaccharide flippase family protein n=1 Tax=Runella sp. CRIBMP TaxID=2683261 RepID=UPI0014132E2F|nr:oligosaccharide flippase family protein [Runella sp. CRIBMP]NBB19504.1 oligosaccharide flippase family protein [Runella sp. CRIBMP]